MWNKSENSDMNKPVTMDAKSSHEYVYVRKDFRQVEATEDRPAHWEWMEARIPKKDWELFVELSSHSEALDDVYAALTELAELIVEG
ncbi:MAG: hypothetical protein IJI21_01900 [Clostridia bacterium]|nr:hypothetical protein [Clostridia bacterium]